MLKDSAVRILNTFGFLSRVLRVHQVYKVYKAWEEHRYDQ